MLIAVLLTLGACSSAVRWEPENVPVTRSPPPVASTARPPAQVSTPNQSVSTLLQEYYTSWKGTPYRFGGTSRRGIDCSAFTQQAMSNALGVSLPRTTRQQLTRGRSIPPQHVRPGDLVFFKTGETLNHVGVMLGPARFMHASTRNGVTISRTDETYWKTRVIDYRRVLE